MREVRRRTGAPVSTDFANSSGTPIVVNTTTGAMSTITDAGSIVTTFSGVTGSASLAFGSINANTTAAVTMTVNGAVAGSCVIMGAPAALESDLVFSGICTATNTVEVRVHNSRGTSASVATATWKATVIQ